MTCLSHACDAAMRYQLAPEHWPTLGGPAPTGPPGPTHPGGPAGPGPSGPATPRPPSPPSGPPRGMHGPQEPNEPMDPTNPNVPPPYIGHVRDTYCGPRFGVRDGYWFTVPR